MADLSIAIGIVGLLLLASLWANKRFREEDRLPMQWSITGKVNWTAPRRIALAFTPALGALIFASLVSGIFGPPRPGQEDLGMPVALAIGIILLAVHAFHLWMINRTVH